MEPFQSVWTRGHRRSTHRQLSPNISEIIRQFCDLVFAMLASLWRLLLGLRTMAYKKLPSTPKHRPPEDEEVSIKSKEYFGSECLPIKGAAQHCTYQSRLPVATMNLRLPARTKMGGFEGPTRCLVISWQEGRSTSNQYA